MRTQLEQDTHKGAVVGRIRDVEEHTGILRRLLDVLLLPEHVVADESILDLAMLSSCCGMRRSWLLAHWITGVISTHRLWYFGTAARFPAQHAQRDDG